MVKGNAHIIGMQHEIGTERRKFRQARVRLKTAAKIIADVTRKAPLKWRQARQFRHAITAQYLVQQDQRCFVLYNAVQQGPAILDFQG